MSSVTEDRQILQARRRNGPNPPASTLYLPTLGGKNDNDDASTRGTKRGFKDIRSPIQNHTPKKNLANDRLKRLRTVLTEEVKSLPNKLSNLYQKVVHPSKPKVSSAVPKQKRRSSDSNSQDVSPKKQHLSSAGTPPVSSRLKVVAKANTCKRREVASTNVSPMLRATTCDPPASGSGDQHVEEEMDWSCTDDNPELQQPSTSQPRLDSFNAQKVVQNSGGPPVTRPDSVSPTRNKSDLLIVVDTNIFISNLSLVRKIVEMDVTGKLGPLVYVPWIVIEELDYLKGDTVLSKTKWKAQEAIKYLNSVLVNKNGRIKGQTLEEANTQKTSGKSQDDKIIACCLQASEKYNNVVLLSNDVNLKNKALINKIPACSHDEIMTRIARTSNKSRKSKRILDEMRDLCCAVIFHCAVKAYGDNWNKLDRLKSPPQTIDECAQVFDKYWMAVFEEHLMKQFRNAIKDLSAFAAKHSNLDDDQLEELNRLSVLCVRVCLFLKDVDHCKNQVEKTIREINDIKES